MFGQMELLGLVFSGTDLYQSQDIQCPTKTLPSRSAKATPKLAWLEGNVLPPRTLYLQFFGMQSSKSGIIYSAPS